MAYQSSAQLQQGGSHEVQLEAALELLADEYAQSILQTLVGETLSASELTDRCEASSVTVYRRLNELEEVGLVVSEMKLDPDGNHRKVFSNALEEITLSLCPDGFEGEMSTAR